MFVNLNALTFKIHKSFYIIYFMEMSEFIYQKL
jgi:hypothetical protein